MSRKANINIDVTLDNENNPTAITWTATDSPFSEPQLTKAIMLSIWDTEKKQSLGIDLWTNELYIEEMAAFCYQSLLKVADTYNKATKNTEIANIIRTCADNFTDAIKKHNEEQEKQN